VWAPIGENVNVLRAPTGLLPEITVAEVVAAVRGRATS
jgi:hypothetical protein